jgi:hypothetical protein
MSFNNGAGPGLWVGGDVAAGGSTPTSGWAYKSPRPPPEPEVSRRGCPAQDQAEQRGGPELERGERMTRVPLYRAGRDVGSTGRPESRSAPRNSAAGSASALGGRSSPPAQETSPTDTRTTGSELHAQQVLRAKPATSHKKQVTRPSL